MPKTLPPKTVVKLVENVRELLDLRRRQQLTQAELIRWCVNALQIDVQHYRLRGHETYHEKIAIIAENKEFKKKALIYLDWLATQLEGNTIGEFDKVSIPADNE